MPEETAREFNALPRRVVTFGRKEDEAKLIRDYGRFGIDLLDEETLRYMDAHFDRIKMLMVDAQRPPHAMSPRLQEWYRARARGTDRDSMMAALRAWLVAPVSEPPAHGMMIEYSHDAILRERIIAAEFLGEWRDPKALPGIGALKDSLKAIGSVRGAGLESNPWVVLNEAAKRIRTPSKAGFIEPAPGSKTEIHRAYADVERMELQRPGRAPAEVLDQSTQRQLWDLMGKCRLGKESSWEGGGSRLIVRFRDGLVAELSPTESGRVTYKDNSHFSYRRSTKLENVALHNLLKRLQEARRNGGG